MPGKFRKKKNEAGALKQGSQEIARVKSEKVFSASVMAVLSSAIRQSRERDGEKETKVMTA